MKRNPDFEKSPGETSTAGIIDRIIREKVVAVVRLRNPKQVPDTVAAIAAGGIRVIEITMTIPGARDIIGNLAGESGEMHLIGAGTVLDPATVHEVVDAGARFVVSPLLEPAVIHAGRSREVPVIPGCLTPTEIQRAMSEGAEMVKIFPASVLGPSFIRDLRGPFPDVRLMPTGGVTIANVGAWLKAGAAAVAIGSDLLDPDLIREKRYVELTARAAELMRNIRMVLEERTGS